jgi:hypothetical protein
MNPGPPQQLAGVAVTLQPAAAFHDRLAAATTGTAPVPPPPSNVATRLQAAQHAACVSVASSGPGVILAPADRPAAAGPATLKRRPRPGRCRRRRRCWRSRHC